MRKLIFSLLLGLMAIPAFCQPKGKISGYVRNELGEPLAEANVLLLGSSNGTTTDKSGAFSIEVPANVTVILRVSHVSYTTREVKAKVSEGDTYEMAVTLLFFEIKEFTIYEDRIRLPKMPPINYKSVPTMTGNIEDIIKSGGLGVRSNNEMSATYNVRGGNFDENLIYVNDIEIYRPFLVRSGQQEGMSFINGDLVQDIYFSSGGFDAKYGDKLSSVLDIRYKDPKETKASASASLLGGTVHFEGMSENHRFTHLSGIRYRSNSYVLNALPTKGDYRPSFADMQTLLGYHITEKWKISLLAHYSNNKFRVVPSTRETEFGTINEALRLTVYYDGQEITQFETWTGAITSEHAVNENTSLKFIASAFHSIETEAFDIQGQYRLDELEKDLGSENFGEVAFTRGVGTFLNHARNELDVWIYNFSHLGVHRYGENKELSWGLKFQAENMDDKLSEWEMLDSAGYSVPQTPADQIVLNELIKAKIALSSNRAMGHIQNNWLWVKTDTVRINDSVFTSNSAFEMNIGARANYWDFSNQVVVSPRVNFRYTPSWFYTNKHDSIRRVNIVFRFATGFYYQPPMYRELRDMNGNISYDIRAQRSIHFVAGSDYYFNMWNRTFKFTTEMYFKKLDYIIPYEVDNVRIRYYAKNNSKGYAAGWDFKVNGEFIKGVESWATLSFLRTYEDIKDDSYTEYYNSDGDKIVPGYTLNNTPVDSAAFQPGHIPRPTDQLVSVGVFFQDEMPRWPSFKVHLNTLFGSKLPYGPPDFNRYKDTLRTPAYFRIDIGFSKQFLTKREKLKPNSMWKKFDDIWLSVEVFNLLGVSNTISYDWIKDVTGRTYSVPNYLTSRRVNLKLVVKF
ncbi:MAG: TonB-dependent receptor [Bacteroidota bacterium]